MGWILHRPAAIMGLGQGIHSLGLFPHLHTLVEVPFESEREEMPDLGSVQTVHSLTHIRSAQVYLYMEVKECSCWRQLCAAFVYANMQGNFVHNSVKAGCTFPCSPSNCDVAYISSHHACKSGDLSSIVEATVC